MKKPKKPKKPISKEKLIKLLIIQIILMVIYLPSTLSFIHNMASVLALVAIFGAPILIIIPIMATKTGRLFTVDEKPEALFEFFCFCSLTAFFCYAIATNFKFDKVSFCFDVCQYIPGWNAFLDLLIIIFLLNSPILILILKSKKSIDYKVSD